MLEEKNKEQKGQIWTALFVVLILISLSDCMSLQALSNVTPLYVEAMGGTATVSGILATVFSIAGGVGRLAGGYLSDAKGRRNIMMLGLALLAIGAVLPAIMYRIPLLVFARALQGAGFAITATAAGSAVADILPKEKMGEGIGYYALGQSMASALGPAFGIWLASGGNFRMVFSVLASIAVAGFMLSFFCRYERNPRYQRHKADALKNQEADENIIRKIFEKRAIPAGLMNLTMGMGFAAYLHFLALYGKSIHFDNIGTFFTISAIVMLLCRLCLSKYIDRINPVLAIIVAMGAGFISFLLVAFCTTPIFFYVAGVLYGFCFGIMMPLCNALAVKDTSPNKRGAATATCYIGADLGMGIGGTVCGLIIDSLGFKMLFCINSCWMIVTAVIGIISFKMKKRAE